MKRMLAVITVELVDESVGEKAEAIEREIVEWFKEGVFFVPWVKQVKSVTIEKEE